MSETITGTSSTFARSHGSLVPCAPAGGDWSILDDPELGLGFSVLRTPPDLRTNVADSRVQTARRWDIASDSSWATA